MVGSIQRPGSPFTDRDLPTLAQGKGIKKLLDISRIAFALLNHHQCIKPGTHNYDSVVVRDISRCPGLNVPRRMALNHNLLLLCKLTVYSSDPVITNVIQNLVRRLSAQARIFPPGNAIRGPVIGLCADRWETKEPPVTDVASFWFTTGFPGSKILNPPSGDSNHCQWQERPWS